MTMHRSKFDIDLQYGQEGENWLKYLGTDQALIEVKTERDQWATTGNAVFEYECRGKPSGIAVTASDYWAHIFKLKNQTLMTYIWATPDLKDTLRQCIHTPRHLGSRLANGGDDNLSKVILIPIPSLWLIGCSTLPLAIQGRIKS